MFQSLKEFRNSREFNELRNNLIIERTNRNGELLCWKCHKPIFKKYDAIAHHKKELTMANVNDYMISMNPDNIEFVHFKCHNELEERFGYEAPQKVFFVYGSPCSGKSTFVRENACKDDLIMDMDNIWELISINARYEKPNRLKTNVFLIRDCILDMIRCRTGKWKNAYVLSSEPFIMSRLRLIDSLNAVPIHINTNKDECLSRLYNCHDRDVKLWEQYINKYFDNFQE